MIQRESEPMQSDQPAFSHTPILLDACVDALAPERGGVYIDCTLGGGGHSEAILRRLPEGARFIGIDRDADALAAAGQRLAIFPAFAAARANFFEIKQVVSDLGIAQVDGILADLGVSSWQLDQPERGFSYQHDATLDMRMDTRAELTAERVVNDYSESELARILRDYGEERWASRIAKFIVAERKKSPIQTTGQLVEIIKAAIPAPARRTGPHPAKRTFQAIRIEVNRELDGLSEAIDDMITVLGDRGRLAIISFHSLEDRIVKQTFARHQNPCTCPPKAPMCLCHKKPDVRILTRKPIEPTEEEKEENPRARSAKLRVIEKIKPDE